MLSTASLKRAGCEHHNPSSAEEKTQLHYQVFSKGRIAYMALFNLFTHIFEVMHLKYLLAPVSHSEDLNALTWVNLHHTVCLHTIQHRFIPMVIHLH